MTRVPEEKLSAIDGASAATSRTFTSNETMVGDGLVKIEGSKYSNILACNQSQAVLQTKSDLQFGRAKWMHRDRSTDQIKSGPNLAQ